VWSIIENIIIPWAKFLGKAFAAIIMRYSSTQVLEQSVIMKDYQK
jgi:hypothetical protein